MPNRAQTEVSNLHDAVFDPSWDGFAGAWLLFMDTYQSWYIMEKCC